METQKEISAIYIVKPEFLHEFCQEIEEFSDVVDDLVLSSVKKLTVCFAQDIWLEPRLVKFQSISEAVKILRQAGHFWYLHPIAKIRRSRLIAEQLRKYPPLTCSFPLQTEIPAIGSFSLLDQNTLIYSNKRLKKWPDGKCFLMKTKPIPPIEPI